MLDVLVVAMAVVGFSTLAYLAALFLDIFLDLDILPLSISIYPPLPAPYSFYLNLEPIHVSFLGLYHPRISNCPLFPCCFCSSAFPDSGGFINFK